MDFGKFEVKHFDELDSTTWKLIRNYCYSNGYWIDHNFGLGRTRTTVILKAVKADWNNKWTLEQIEWVEERYDPLSRTTRKRKQELTGTPNLPSNLEPNTANSRGLSLEPQTQQFQDIKFETPPQQPFMLQDYRNLSDPWLQQYNQRLLYEQQHPAYRHQSTYGYQPTHGSQYAYELQHAYENQYRPNDYQLVPTPVPNFRSTSMKPHFDDSTSTDNHQPVPNGSISEIRDDCERVPERLTAPNDTSTADTSTLDTSTSNRSIPDTGTPKTNPYIATVFTTNPVSTTSTAKYISVAPPTQGTWRSNDYVSAVRLVDAWLFYEVGRGAVIYILGGRHKHARPRLSSQSRHHKPNITSYSQHHISLRRDNILPLNRNPHTKPVSLQTRHKQTAQNILKGAYYA